MHGSIVSTLLLAAGLAAAAPYPQTSTSSNTTSEPATWHFFPYKYVGCRMDQNPHAPQTPSAFNVTSGHCVTPSYAFEAYVQYANELAADYCSVAIYSEPNCKGTTSAAVDSQTTQCVAASGGASVFMTCGP